MGLRVERQVVQDIPEVHVGGVAQRHHRREADLVGLGPVQDRGADRARLGDERQVAGQTGALAEGGVQPEARA